MSYPLWVATGVVLAFLATRLVKDPAGLDARPRPGLLLAAVVGALAGALLGELPADLNGWAWHQPGLPDDHLPLGGRTVLGGLIGAWLSVEAAKRFIGVAGPTGDGFALPLALALACGRMGCASAGCCAGIVCPEQAWWRDAAVLDALGERRFPAQYAEVAVHLACAAALWWCIRHGRLRGRRLAAYLTIYALVRFLLELVRPNPAILAGLTYYQLLAIGLFLLAGGTWLARSVERAGPQPGAC